MKKTNLILAIGALLLLLIGSVSAVVYPVDMTQSTPVWPGDTISSNADTVATAYCTAMGYGSGPWNNNYFQYTIQNSSTVWNYYGGSPLIVPTNLSRPSASNFYTITSWVDCGRGHWDGSVAYWSIAVGSPPTVANFVATPVSGAPPLSVAFNDTSSGNPTAWTWNFGDGNTGSGRNVSHTYQNIGLYSVSETVSNSNGSANTTKINYINVTAPPGYGMTVEPNNINVNGTTVATVTSTGNFALVDHFNVQAYGSSDLSPLDIKVNGNTPDWKNVSGSWKQWNDGANAYNVAWASFPSTFTITGWTNPGNFTVNGLIIQQDGYVSPEMTDNVNVAGGEGFKIISIRVTDGNSLITGATAGVKYPDGTWYNKTILNKPVEFTIAKGTYIGYAGSSSPLYIPSDIRYVAINGPTELNIPLIRVDSTSAGNTTISVFVEDQNHKSIPGARLALQPGGKQISTDSGGKGLFVVTAGNYTVSTSKEGYGEQTTSIFAQGLVYSVFVTLVPTAAPTVTPTITDQDGNVITATPTVDIRTSAQKDQASMDQIREMAPALIALCGIFTMLYIMGWKP